MWFAPAKLLREKVWDRFKAADTVAADCFGWFLTRFGSNGGRAQNEQLHPAMCCKLLETRELRDWLVLSDTDWEFPAFKPFSCADSAKIAPLRPRGSVSSIWASMPCLVPWSICSKSVDKSVILRGLSKLSRTTKSRKSAIFNFLQNKRDQ